jgi:rRNA maturation endonuclease Nob1
LTTITLQRQNTPTRQQLEMLRPISVEEIEDTQNKVNEHLLSTSGMNKEEIENASVENQHFIDEASYDGKEFSTLSAFRLIKEFNSM